MNVTDKHALYDKMEADWISIADVKEGERTIKGKGAYYVPALEGQNPNEYTAYINRGVFYGATSRTIAGLAGTVLRKGSNIIGPKELAPFFKSATKDGRSIKEVIEECVENVISYGRYGILVDVKPNQMPYFSLYKAIDIYNWKVEDIDGERKLTYLTLHETIDPSSDGNFAEEEVDIIRILFLDENGLLVQRVYQENFVDDKNKEWMVSGEDTFPTVKGLRLNYIPFVCIGSLNNLISDVNKPPILDLVNLNLAHWRTTVDYYHGLHFCALPTIYALGFTETEGKGFKVGPGNVILSRNAESKVGMLEFTGQGLKAVEKALESLENQMAVMGSRLLETQKKAAEAFETVRLRSTGDSATLSSIVDNIEAGVETAVGYAQKYIASIEPFSLKLNRDFNPSEIDPQLIVSLLQAAQAGKISTYTFLYNLKAGEVLPGDSSIEEEMARIKVEQRENPVVVEPVKPPPSVSEKTNVPLKEKEEDESDNDDNSD